MNYLTIEELNEQVLQLKSEVEAWEYVAKQLITMLPIAYKGEEKHAVDMTVELLQYSLDDIVKSAEDAKDCESEVEEIKSLSKLVDSVDTNGEEEYY